MDKGWPGSNGNEKVFAKSAELELYQQMQFSVILRTLLLFDSWKKPYKVQQICFSSDSGSKYSWVGFSLSLLERSHIGFNSRMRQVKLCRAVRTTVTPNAGTGFSTKPSDGESPVLEFWECEVLIHCHYSQVHSNCCASTC